MPYRCNGNSYILDLDPTPYRIQCVYSGHTRHRLLPHRQETLDIRREHGILRRLDRLDGSTHPFPDIEQRIISHSLCGKGHRIDIDFVDVNGTGRSKIKEIQYKYKF